jgi:ferredoxin
MKFYVDQSKCKSHGICVQEYPDLFKFEPGSKKAVAIDKDFPPEQVIDSYRILRVCPVDAIWLTDSVEESGQD